jgi:hypothetical protein
VPVAAVAEDSDDSDDEPDEDELAAEASMRALSQQRAEISSKDGGEVDDELARELLEKIDERVTKAPAGYVHWAVRARHRLGTSPS